MEISFAKKVLMNVGQPPPAVLDRRGRLSHIFFAIFCSYGEIEPGLRGETEVMH